MQLIRGFRDQHGFQIVIVDAVVETICGQIKAANDLILLIQNDHISKGDSPRVPNLIRAVVIDQWEIGHGVNGAVSCIETVFIHCNQRDLQRGIFCVYFVLHLREKTKLASAIASCAMDKIPPRDLL